MNKILILMGLLILAGCATTSKPTVITNVQTIVIAPPPSLFKACPTAPKAPKSDTLTNQQVVDYIQNLYSSLRKCNISMQKIEEFVAEAKKLHAK